MNDRPREMTAEVKRGIVMWVVKAVVGLFFVAALLFLVAGRWDWLWGWLFIGLFAAVSATHVVIMVPRNPALLAERSGGLSGEEGSRRDKLITGLAAGLLPLIGWIIAGLEVRFGWSPPMPVVVHLVGAAAFVLGWGMVLWATASNAFFATTVRIQAGQRVQTGGPYRFVRHPGYAGGLLYQLATPLLLGSWWALIPVVITVPLFMLRVILEERLLCRELAGYSRYTARVRYRLLPGVW